MLELQGAIPQSRDVYVIDPDTLEVKTNIDGYISFWLERSDYGIGKMQFTAEASAQGIEEIVPGDILCMGGSGLRAGVIEDFEYDRERSAKTVTFSGYTLKGYALYRVIVPPTETEDPDALGWDRVIGTAEEVFRHYAKNHLITPRNAERAIPRLDLDELHKPPLGIQTPWQCELGEALADVFEEIGGWTKCGWDIRLDIPGKRMVFVINPGRDLSFGNTEGNDPVVFSPEHDNLMVSRYIETHDKYTNAVYIGGAGEDENRFVLTAYVDEDGRQIQTPYRGIRRKEKFISAGNIDVPDDLLFEGLHKHQTSRKRVRSIEGQVDAGGIYKYGEHWDLGDTVTVQFDIDKRRVSANERIVGVTEVYERGLPALQSLDVVFGQEPARVTDRIKNLEKRV